MSKTGQENVLEQAEVEASRKPDSRLGRNYWRWLMALSLIGMAACFVVWLGTAMFAAGDQQRGRTSVTLDNGRTLIIDYPQRILADNSIGTVHLTADSLESMSVAIELPQDMPLLLSSVVPSTTLLTDNSAMGQLIINWPTPSPTLLLSSTSNTGDSATAQPTQVPSSAATMTATPGSLPAPTVIGIIPVMKQPHTISLGFKNAGSERSPTPLLPFLGGFATSSLKIANSAGAEPINLQVETTDRANWRAFAKEYSFLVILPTIIAALSFFYKSYTDQHKVQQQRAETVLERFKQAISAGQMGDVTQSWNNLQHYSRYLSSEELERSRRLYEFSLGEPVVAGEATDFRTWPDAWAGALKLAHDSTRLSQETAFRYTRTFPVDQLSRTGEERFRVFRDTLNLPHPQQHAWPMRAALPDGYSTDLPTSIADIGLFSGSTADDSRDRNRLFSEAQWFWSEHSTYSTTKLSAKSFLILGEAGCGRTALALALTRYAEEREQVLGCYHSQPVTLSEAQRSLAQELLHFLRWRTTWLTELTQEDRELLAVVLSSTLDANYILSELSAHEPTQFKPGEPNNAIWEEQAIVELRLLKQSFEQIQGKHPLPPTQWFEALVRCAKKLDFQRLRIALDMTAEQYEPWRTAHLWQFLSTLPSNQDTPVQLIVLAPGQKENFDVRAIGMNILELTWQSGPDDSEGPLVHMLRHRLIQRITDSDETTITEFVPEGVQRALCEAAHHNPRRLALLWQHIAATYPEAKRVDPNMVDDAEAAISS